MKALVIGGTKGFGKEISENLVGKGFDLITVSRAKKGYKGNVHYKCNLSNLISWKKVINKILKQNKDINLIFFVYGFVKPKKFTALNANDWLKSYSTNVVYVSLLLQELENNKHKYKNIKIATIGSQWSYKTGHDYLVPYIVSKHGLKSLTEDFARRNGNITINHICVPTMDTPGYYSVRKSFEKIGKRKLIDQLSRGIVANHKQIAKSVLKLVLRNNKSGVTFMITSEGKINPYYKN